jgi:ubiquinone/menaquinone biosynthesis C-methylase UbiE
MSNQQTDVSTLYDDKRGLFVSSTVAKCDDVPLIESSVTKKTRRVADLCGGFGRIRLNITDSGIQWTIIDRATEIMSLGRRLLAKHGISPILIAPEMVTMQ